MKRFLLICLVALLACTKGYGQLMQANTISSSNKAYAGDTVAYIKKVSNKTDSLGVFAPLKQDAGLVIYLDSLDILKKQIQDRRQRREQLRLLDAQSTQIAKINKELDGLEKQVKTKNDSIAKILNDSQKLHDQVNSLLIEKYQTYLEVLDKQLENYKTQIDKNDKDALTQFDTLMHVSKGITGDHTKRYKEIVEATANIKRLYGLLKIERDSFNTAYIELSRIQKDVKRYEGFKNAVYQVMIKTQEELIKSHTALKDSTKAFVTTYNDYVTKFNGYAKIINDQLDKAGKSQPSSDQYASALAGINKVFGDNGTLTPTVSLVAQKKFNSSETGSFYGEVRLFTGGSTGDKLNNGTSNLFVPEASTFGFMANFTFGFISAHKSAKKSEETGLWEQRLGVNLGFYYLGKKLQPDTLTSFNTNIFHIKAGLQYILIPHVLSAYINTNAMLVSTNVNRVEQYYSSVSKLRTFTSFGIESYLDLNEVKDFHLLINLGFVAVNNDVRSWTDNHDSVIPSAKVSLVKTFGW